MEAKLLEFLGMPRPISKSYESLAEYYQVDELNATQEAMMTEEFNAPISLEFSPKEPIHFRI